MGGKKKIQRYTNIILMDILSSMTFRPVEAFDDEHNSKTLELKQKEKRKTSIIARFLLSYGMEEGLG